MRKKISLGMLAMLLSLVMVITLLPCTSDVQAKTWTKAEVNKKISALNKQIKKYQKQDKENKKGKTSFFGTAISYDPLIVRCDTFMGTAYYWVNNPEKATRILDIASGWGVTTGQYRNYGNYTCSVINAVKVKSYTSKIDSLKKKRSKYKDALITIPYSYDVSMMVGEKEKIKVYWTEDAGKKYNVCKFSSSDKSVVTVDKNGKMRAVGAGTAKITLKGSVSGKSSKIKVKVSQKVNEINFTNATDILDYGDGLTQSVYVAYLEDSCYLDIETQTDVKYDGDISVAVDEDFAILDSVDGTKATLEVFEPGSFLVEVEAGGAYACCVVVAVDCSAADVNGTTCRFVEKEYNVQTDTEFWVEYLTDISGNGIKHVEFDSENIVQYSNDYEDYDAFCFVTL